MREKKPINKKFKYKLSFIVIIIKILNKLYNNSNLNLKNNISSFIKKSSESFYWLGYEFLVGT